MRRMTGTFSFGGGTATADSLRIFLKDPYAAQMGNPAECSSDFNAGFAILNALLAGAISNYFSVAPAIPIPAWQTPKGARVMPWGAGDLVYAAKKECRAANGDQA